MADFQSELAALIERGGIVMVPLLALSVVSLGLILERAWFWTRVHRAGQLRRLGRLNEALRTGDRPGAARLASDDRSPYGDLARRLIEHGSGDAVAVEAVEAVRPRLDRFMVSLSTIVTAAPLLGILGTVIGIIQSFQLLGEGAGGALTDPSAVSAGIAEALLTTALGLVVALVTLFPYMIFRAQMERALGRVESLIAAAQQGSGAAPAAAPAGAQAARPEPRSAAPAPTSSSPVAGRSR